MGEPDPISRMNDLPSTSSSPSEPPTVARYFRDGEPDWEVIDFDVLCSRCGYNLKMLTQPRCPECGLTFDWWTVLDRSAWRSDFLFEHHARRRPVRSYFTTLRQSLRPIRFWRQVSIHHRIHVKPLLFMIAMAVPSFFGLLFVLAWGGAILLDQVHRLLQPMARPFTNSFWLDITDELARALGGVSRGFMANPEEISLFILMLTVAFLGTLGLLCTLRQTLGRCRVRTVQLLRVMTYAAAAFCIILAALIPLGVMASVILDQMTQSDVRWIIVLELALLTSFPIGLGFYVGAGLKHYLRLPRPYILAFTAAFTGGLLGMTSVVVWVWF